LLPLGHVVAAVAPRFWGRCPAKRGENEEKGKRSGRATAHGGRFAPRGTVFARPGAFGQDARAVPGRANDSSQAGAALAQWDLQRRASGRADVPGAGAEVRVPAARARRGLGTLLRRGSVRGHKHRCPGRVGCGRSAEPLAERPAGRGRDRADRAGHARAIRHHSQPHRVPDG